MAPDDSELDNGYLIKQLDCPQDSRRIVGGLPEHSPEHCRSIAGTLPELYRNSTGTLPELYRNSTGTLPELYRRITGTLPENYRNSTGELPEVYRRIAGTLLEAKFSVPRTASALASVISSASRRMHRS